MEYKKKEINWDKLDALLQFKVTKSFCADYLETSEDTLERRIKKKHGVTFSEYREKKAQGMGLKLQQKAIQMAMSGNVTMMIFCLKNIANWTDKTETEHSSNTEKPVSIVITQAPGKRTLEEIEND